MPLPRLSPRRWFWLLTLFTFIWGWAGGGAPNPKSSTPPLLHRIQSGIAINILTPLAIPGTALAQFFQNQWASAIRVVSTPTGKESIPDLQKHIAELQAQVDERDRLLIIDQERFNDLRVLAPQGLAASDLLSANIRGYDIGAGANLLTLDRGSSDGVRTGMPVISQLSLIGRVDKVGSNACLVRLITDPQMKTQAVIARRLNDGSLVLNNEPCLIEGLGNGRLQCNTIKITDVSTEPLKGDLVKLADANWPAKVRYMVLGEVEDVGRKDTQMLRYDLKITPRVNVSSLQTALIVLKE